MITQQTESPRQALACLIIDDPLLRPKYGCLDYEKLLKEMKTHNFFTEIAFIPWNYKRSDPKTVRLFADNSDYYAICVHGCNHTGNEFGKGDYQQLKALSSAALWRMEQHKRLTGLSYDPVIVFPQGLFSSVAMKALTDQGYFAAFNSTLRATDGEEPLAVENLSPATTMYHGFPLFLRRYPKDKSLFAQDLASARPIIITSHHGDFRNGYKSMTDLVDEINSLGDIKWTSLLNIAEYYLGTKAATAGQMVNPSPSEQQLNSKTTLRRFFSEVRDNYIETSNIFSKAYKMVRR